MEPIEAPTLEEVRAARERLAGTAVRTPLVRLAGGAHDGAVPIYLKLENLQPIGSFKLRGAANAMRSVPREILAGGVYTASAGNMAQGVGWAARELGVAATAVVPDSAPETKIAAIERLGARVVKVPFDVWWQVLVEHRYPGLEGFFIHPCSDRAVMAGNGTIGLEILEDLPEVGAVFVPYGGGGLACGIAAAVRAIRPEVPVFACEVDSGAPFAASLAAGEPTPADYRRSFVDGIAGKTVMEDVWPLARRLLAGSRVVSVADAAAAVRLLAERNRVVAEGAGAVPVAAALAARDVAGPIVCIVSGGNIDSAKLVKILGGEVP